MTQFRATDPEWKPHRASGFQVQKFHDYDVARSEWSQNQRYWCLLKSNLGSHRPDALYRGHDFSRAMRAQRVWRVQSEPLLFSNAKSRKDQIQNVVAGRLASERVEMAKGSVQIQQHHFVRNVLSGCGARGRQAF